MADQGTKIPQAEQCSKVKKKLKKKITVILVYSITYFLRKKGQVENSELGNCECLGHLKATGLMPSNT